MALLSDPLKIKNLTIKNRICVPPMVCYHWADESGQVTEKKYPPLPVYCQGRRRIDHSGGRLCQS